MSKNYYDPSDLKKFTNISAWNEELGQKFFDYYGKVFEEGALSAREKSLIALAVAHVVKCPYHRCLYQGRSTARHYQRRNDGSCSCGCSDRKWRYTGTWGSNDE